MKSSAKLKIAVVFLSISAAIFISSYVVNHGSSDSFSASSISEPAFFKPSFGDSISSYQGRAGALEEKISEKIESLISLINEIIE